MILAIDAGNSNIVIGCCNDNKILFIERLTTRHNATELEYAISFKEILEIHKISLKSITGSIISSVVPSITGLLKRAVVKLTGINAMIVGKGLETGLDIKIDNPLQLGSDLIVDAVAGIHEYGAPLLIFDMGTATTISVIDKNKSYIGGVIIPGIKVSLDSLVGKTSQLPRIGLESPEYIIGRNTIDCMKSGIIYSTVSIIEGMIDKIENELGEKTTVIATGGLAGIVVPLCGRDIILDDALLLKGLMIIYNLNKGS